MAKLPVNSTVRRAKPAQSPLMLALWLALVLSIKPASANPADIVEELKNCARISDANARAACYESLGKSVLANDTESASDPAPSVATESTEAEPAAEATPEEPSIEGALPEGIGGGEFARKAGIKAETHRGKVKSCKRGLDKRWFYIFEGGQIWKQSDTRKRSYKGGCDFYVSVIKDAFGYLMQVDGEERTTRISRFR